MGSVNQTVLWIERDRITEDLKGDGIVPIFDGQLYVTDQGTVWHWIDDPNTWAYGCWVGLRGGKALIASDTKIADEFDA